MTRFTTQKEARDGAQGDAMINEPNGEHDVGSVTIWRTAKLQRQWSIKVTENSSEERLAQALLLARRLDRQLMRSRPKKPPEEPDTTVKVHEKTARRHG
jgi:hypothetical protein